MVRLPQYETRNELPDTVLETRPRWRAHRRSPVLLPLPAPSFDFPLLSRGHVADVLRLRPMGRAAHADAARLCCQVAKHDR